MGIKLATNTFNIPKTTLKRRFSKQGCSFKEYLGGRRPFPKLVED